MKSDIMSIYSVEVVEMPYFPCNGCGVTLEVNISDVQSWNKPNKASNLDRLIGSASCRQCGSKTGFEISDNVIAYVATGGSYGNLPVGLSENVRKFYAEAEMCFRNGSPNASAAMCRASIEVALNDKEIQGRDLYNKIENAKDILGEVAVGLAHGSRLITRDAIHNEQLINLSDMPSILSATVMVLNKLSSDINSAT